MLFLFLACIANAQNIAVKTNALYWATLSPNVGLEIKLDRQFTTDLQAVYNPWEFNNGKTMKFWLAQPELRYWFVRPSKVILLEFIFMGHSSMRFPKTRFTTDILLVEGLLTVITGFCLPTGILKRLSV